MLLAIALAGALAASDAEAAPVHDGGVCAGLAWVTLAQDEKVSLERGPDFHVLRFEGPKGPEDHWWGVYAGFAAQVRGNGPLLLARDGVTVRRAIEDGKFRGYVATKDRWQNHFFGSVFNGTDADKAFFARIDFGSRGQMLCAQR